jgi:hypothetical protein
VTGQTWGSSTDQGRAQQAAEKIFFRGVILNEAKDLLFLRAKEKALL